MALVGSRFKLVLRRTGSLRPHEETIPGNVERISKEIRRDGVQKDPIIIDGETGTVLDGMHRLAAFEKLGLDFAVCCSVDYSSKAVVLSRWARVYGSSEPRRLREAAGVVGLAKEVRPGTALDLLEKRNVSCAALTQGWACVPGSRESVERALDLVRALDKLADRPGWTRDFVPEEEIDIPLQDPTKMVVLVERLLKDDVVAAAKNGRLFPCKTSMHSVDPRPVGVRFPIDSLNSSGSALLSEWVDVDDGKILPEDTLYEGRRYKERLLMLRPD